jgi:hypothetical protein
MTMNGPQPAAGRACVPPNIAGRTVPGRGKEATTSDETGEKGRAILAKYGYGLP